MLEKLILIAACLTAEPDRWPAFLGQDSTPVNAQSIPLAWSTGNNVAWTANLPGKGQSSPVIWENRVYITCIDGTMKDRCILVALNLADGQPAWIQQCDSSQKVRSNYFQSRSAPTPVVDANGVYAFFETGNLVAFNHDGKPLWRRSLTDDYGPFESNIGLASSPAQFEDSIALLIDHEGPSYLLSVDKRTGLTLWKTERDSRTSYSSPTVVPVGDAHHIVCSSAGSIDGYDPATGRLLWTYTDHIGGNRMATPLAFENGRFVLAASPGMHNENEAEARETNGIMSVEMVDGAYQSRFVWRTREAMPAYNTPIVHQGLAYWINRAGVVFCFDVKTGEKIYTNRIRQGCWATPIGIGERIYLFGKDGLTTVIATGKDFRVLAENQLWDAETTGSESQERGRASGRDANAGADHSGRRPAGAGESASETSRQPPRAGRTLAPDEKRHEPAEAGGNVAPGRPESREGQTAEEVGQGASAGRSSRSPEDRARSREQGDNRFADPVQYGVAVVNGSLIIRTGSVVYCIREMRVKAAAHP